MTSQAQVPCFFKKQNNTSESAATSYFDSLLPPFQQPSIAEGAEQIEHLVPNLLKLSSCQEIFTVTPNKHFQCILRRIKSFSFEESWELESLSTRSMQTSSRQSPTTEISSNPKLLNLPLLFLLWSLPKSPCCRSMQSNQAAKSPEIQKPKKKGTLPFRNGQIILQPEVSSSVVPQGSGLPSRITGRGLPCQPDTSRFPSAEGNQRVSSQWRRATFQEMMPTLPAFHVVYEPSLNATRAPTNQLCFWFGFYSRWHLAMNE